MENYIWTIIAMIVLVMLSAYFSATETAFLSMNRIRMKALADDKNKRAALVLRMSENFDKLISTILIGNNIVNIALSTIATVFFVDLFEKNGATISTVIVTVVVLIFGEITPKGLAKDSADSFALFSAPLIRLISFVLAPLNVLFGGVKTLISKIFRTKEIKRDTEQELITIVDEAETEGNIDEEEGELIRSAIEFTDLAAEDILSPRVDFVAIPADATNDEIADAFADSGYSRLPVFEGTLDNIVGVIHHKDFFNRVVRRSLPLDEIVKPPVFITGSMKIFDLLRLLQQRKSHMAFITDEYGGTVGLVTMEDILEELVGDIWDEHDEIVENFVPTGENKFKILGSAEVEDLFEQFELEEVEKDEIASTTVSGWLIELFGTIPAVGDSVQYQNLTLTVLEADAKRVTALEALVSPKEDEEE
ncbi:MAG: HlyC/CorC family transporter, partial [Clostridia bacterium]|nr:HlyC/CorC family transporter [Clostridia bacterium]